ncbi:ribonuclease E activity regulator RraA [Ruegeria lacuscaerulensis]|uniref:ribonuclease E activity regulator RraA n=1 Tax=Ruegeria lacuscaerulensis TaxID=55218 RepID=UPI00147B91A2|nr:ribonuclease E activity regulator RraA [Ruegeria lacuscaerulensis]
MKLELDPLATSDLNDAHPEKVRRVTIPLRDFGKKKRFAGLIRTAVTMEDSRLVQQKLFRTPGEGGVIVFDGGGSCRSALLGDVNAAVLRDNGWAGIIINGALRDSALLAGIDIGIKALGVTPVRSTKKGIGALDIPVAFGHVLFEPGQCVYCDEDGVLVSDEPLRL